MKGLKDAFWLGRPGAEALFEVNPSAWGPTNRALKSVSQAIDGTVTAVTMSRHRPVFTLSGNYCSDAQLSQLRSLAAMDDTPLIFQPLDFNVGPTLNGQPVPWPFSSFFECWLERVTPDSTTVLTLPSNSFLRASQLRTAAGYGPTTRIQGIWDSYPTSPALYQRTGSGTERYAVSAGAGTAYSQNFDGLAIGDLAGQVDGGQLWTKIVGGVNDTFDVTAVSPITGTRSLRMLGIGNRMYRRPFGFSATSAVFTFKAKMLDVDGWNVVFAAADIPVSAPTSSFAGSTAGVRFRGIGGGRVELAGSHDSDGTIQTTTGLVSLAGSISQVRTFQLELFDGVCTLSVDGIQIGSIQSGIKSFDRVLLGGAGYNPFDSGRVDDFIFYATNGAYNHATRQITLTTPLSDLTPRWVTYQNVAIACLMIEVPSTREGGWVDFSRYDVELRGA